MNCKRIIGIRVTREILKIMGAKIFLLKYNKKRILIVRILQQEITKI
ncbi:hypothetical protein RGU76_27755 [Bacillus pseudomycoides]|nr:MULTISPECIES: hypothetical protein [Bacillus]MCX2829591.1 hypothetical protein [Bacillus sp. DHT2]MDR4918640.1 hypothetical protein [Bacillus pseudomycoides]